MSHLQFCLAANCICEMRGRPAAHTAAASFWFGYVWCRLRGVGASSRGASALPGTLRQWELSGNGVEFV
eukprot:CAMPEP_0180146890 /NCGR_PEP_ID=MMETSP0986-20121125/18863_1 /TAXON_ID=697907 /ORGANISM="non described non described, Strain CCMP2293" /LENGTH=68 /DNA_ID=CAMNT_0022092201 /DNA_START=79 /DNA_END=282 /DNA_ORIENTATION=-